MLPCCACAPLNNVRCRLNKFRRFAKLAGVLQGSAVCRDRAQPLLAPAEVDLVFVRTLQIVEKDALRVRQHAAKEGIKLTAKEKADLDRRVAAARRRHLDASAFGIAIEQLSWATLWKASQGNHGADTAWSSHSSGGRGGGATVPSPSKTFIRSPRKAAAAPQAIMAVEVGASIERLPTLNFNRLSPLKRAEAVSQFVQQYLIPLAAEEAMRRQDEHPEIQAMVQSGGETKEAEAAHKQQQREEEKEKEGKEEGGSSRGLNGRPPAEVLAELLAAAGPRNDASLAPSSHHRYRKSDVGEVGAAVLGALDDAKANEMVKQLALCMALHVVDR